MKGVAFVDQIVFSFSGNHFSHAVALGDVDGDGVSAIHTADVASTPSYNIMKTMSHCISLCLCVYSIKHVLIHCTNALCLENHFNQELQGSTKNSLM